MTEQPTSDPLVVRCQVCVLSGPYDTIRFGAKSVGRCESRDFEVQILSGGLGDGERRPDQCAAGRVHGDNTTVPVLAKGKTITGRLWTYVRDDRPFAGPAPPAAIFYYSRDRGGENPKTHLAGYSGILQADAYAGFNDLYALLRQPVPLTDRRDHQARSRSTCPGCITNLIGNKRPVMNNPTIQQPLSNDELNRLGKFLDEIGAPAMTMESLDGYFAALICSPDMVLSSEYLPEIWGEDGRASGRYARARHTTLAKSVPATSHSNH